MYECKRIGGCLHNIGLDVCCCDTNTCDGEPIEAYHFSFIGRPYTQIIAEKASIIPVSKDERALDVLFGGGKYTVRILIDSTKCELVGFKKNETS